MFMTLMLSLFYECYTVSMYINAKKTSKYDI